MVYNMWPADRILSWSIFPYITFIEAWLLAAPLFSPPLLKKEAENDLYCSKSSKLNTIKNQADLLCK